MAKSYKKIQEEFDKDKWLESEKNGVDMSGIMVICDWCDYCCALTCTATREEIVAKSLCARAIRNREKFYGKGAKNGKEKSTD